jgi:LytS/YehU family sensor histidine kinase
VEHNWDTTSINKIAFNDLQYGDYRFEVQAFDTKHANVKSSVRSLRFSIQPHYYEQPLFWLVLFVLLLITVGVTIYLLMRASKTRALNTARLKSRLNELTLRGLQEQMNPHFIFNSLCTMQHLIANGSEEDVRDYLVDFSRLVRNMLEHSRNENHSLHDEIEFLRNYVRLEHIRYRNSFDTVWDIAIEEDEMEDVYIPTMLLQPLVENAIKYGVFHSGDKRGLVEICIDVKDIHFLEIIVKNKGYVAHRKLQSGYRSVALKVIQERLAIYRKGNRCGFFELTFTSDTAVATILLPI